MITLPKIQSNVMGTPHLTTPCSRPRIALLSCARLAAPAVVCAAADESSLDSVWDNSEDDVYAELLEK